jgi:GNAT superfamily N-acetyltransferase
MDSTELGRLADVNLAVTWSSLGRASGASIGGDESCPFVASGIPAAFFNGVYATAAVADPEAVIDDAIEFMAAHEVPWLLWVREGVDDALLDAGRRRGLSDAGGPPGMVLPSIGEKPALPDGFEVERVVDASGIDTFRDVAARGFEMPHEILERLVTPETVSDPNVVAVIGSVDGVAVSTALACVSGATVGIYNVATPEAYRRRGFGEAITWAAIEAGEGLGGDHAALQASELGAPVYRSMGFVDVGRYVQLEGPPTSPAQR